MILETRKTVSSGEVYQSDVEFAVDDTGLKILFAYFDEKGPEFRSYEYRVAWHRAGDKVFRESAEWRRGDWEAISIDWPLEVYRIDIEVDSKTAYSEVIVEISCEYFDEKRSQVGEITTTSGPLIELTFGCNRNTPVSYKVTARSRDGETFLTRIKPLDGDYIYVHEKMFAQE